MKSKILLLVGIFACVSAYGETDYIDMQIRELEQRRDELKKQIAECEENTRGYKIAGIATLGATGVGVVGNIALHNEIKKIEQSKNGGGYSGRGSVGNTVTEDTCASDPICSWERQCEMTNYKVKNCDHDTDCCAADGCPCEK